MKRLDLLALALPTTLAAAILLQASHPSIFNQPSVAESSADGSLAPAPALADARRKVEVQRRLRQAESTTYISEILLQRDSALTRWPERVEQPLNIWIQPSADLEDWDPGFPEIVRDAFVDWQATGIPVRFRFVPDRERADVSVSFRDTFSDPISGKTRWARDDEWWIVEANISLALHHNGREPLDSAAVKAIALHEVGHLLGLDHTMDALNIMSPRVRVRELSTADRATVRLLYTLPPGDVR